MSAVFADLVGQASVAARFSEALRDRRTGRGALHHAYLFTGIEGLGKRAFAEELGALIVAGDDDDAYERARRGVHPDLNVIERQGDLIRREQVDPIVADLSLKPFMAEDRVWVLPEAEKLHAAAANKLLKSLEEPPPHVVFLLASDEEERLLPTIVSRCEVVPFEPVSKELLLGLLRERTELADETREAVAALAGGSPGSALRLADDAAGPDRRGALVDATVTALTGQPAAERVVALIKDYGEEVTAAVKERLASDIAVAEASLPDERDRAWRIDQLELRAKRDTTRETRRVVLWCLDVVIAVLRDAWVARVEDGGVLLDSDHGARIAAAAAGCTSAALLQALTAANAVRREMSRNIDRELAVLALFARIEEVSAQCRER